MVILWYATQPFQSGNEASPELASILEKLEEQLDKALT
jgi:hypothetical protein